MVTEATFYAAEPFIAGTKANNVFPESFIDATKPFISPAEAEATEKKSTSLPKEPKVTRTEVKVTRTEPLVWVLWVWHGNYSL